MESYLILLLCILQISTGKTDVKIPLGHGEELGRHRPSVGHVEELHEIPTPSIFWENYASAGTPVVFKGAAKRFPAFKLWTDEFLTENFGNLEVKLESKKEKDETPIGERGLGRDTIKSYLSDYHAKDSYVVSQLPDPMARDVDVLSCLSCGTFTKRIMEATLWLSSGGTSSLLHRDADNAINCLLNGTKDWILIDPKHEDKIPIAQGDKGYGGFAVLDVNSVNLIKYSDFQHVPWQYANITAGDCLFLPYGYWHQVRSYGSKNMAVSVLFSRLKAFNPSGCDKTEYAPFSLADAGMVWTYPGYGPQTLGNNDPFEIRDALAEMIGDLESRNEKIDNSDLFFKWFTEADMLDHESQRKNLAELMYQELKTFCNGQITSEFIMKLSIDQLKSLVMLIDGDPANTEEYEHAIFAPEDVREMIETLLIDNDGSFSQEMLRTAYETLGGSEKIARELFLDMDLNEDEIVTREEISQTLDDVLVKFQKEYQHDPSST
ncbi:Lysine-specific demethylase 8 [Paramuricea clavata]|uniref:Lysine-specific demethylase 8 n=1 Tax=Paramuricea clavata TaxID=317549 RepID=A0A7D9E8I0_PARCT|nr:Lysine-specific demethylase 8 [Paramuricea clavata]